jgi:hypothetical protein
MIVIGVMKTLALHFDFSKNPSPRDPDMSLFRHDLSRSLETVLKASGGGRWRGGRYARGVVTIFLEVPDPRSALDQVRSVLGPRGLLDKMTVTPMAGQPGGSFAENRPTEAIPARSAP